MAQHTQKRRKLSEPATCLHMDPINYVLEMSKWIQHYKNACTPTQTVYAAAGPTDAQAPALLPGVQPPLHTNTSEHVPNDNTSFSPEQKQYILDITKKNIYNTERALITTQQFELASKHKSDALVACLLNVAGLCINNNPNEMGFVEISTVEHENTQLVFNRVSKSIPDASVPVCANGANCYTCFMQYTDIPLQIYLSADTQAHFDATGTLPTTSVHSSVCLLCIRWEFKKNAIAYISAIENQHRQHNTNSAFPIPPFQNLCNQPGGYNASDMTSFPNDVLALPITICAPSGKLILKTTPDKKITYFDQGNLIFNPNATCPDFQ